METINYIERAKTDLDYIFKNFTAWSINYNNNFSEKLNNDIEYIITKDLESTPKSETVLKLHNIKDILITQKETIEVKIIAIVDYYWFVDGKESGIPGSVLEIEGQPYKNKEYDFNLHYREINGRLILIRYEDGNGWELGELWNSNIESEYINKHNNDPKKNKSTFDNNIFFEKIDKSTEDEGL